MHSSNGVLIAKSAFKQITKEASDIPINQSLGRIWKTRIHDRLKMHLWRLAAGLLPTKDTLTRFVTSLDPICVLCDQECEDAIHLFWDCPMAKALWFGCRWSIRTDQFPITNATQLVIMLMSPPDEWGIKSEDKDGFILIGSLILDQIWKCKNLKVHEGYNVSMEYLERRGTVLGSEHHLANNIILCPPSTVKKACWQKPPIDCLKINCDAAVGNSYSSIAIVARD